MAVKQIQMKHTKLKVPGGKEPRTATVPATALESFQKAGWEPATTADAKVAAAAEPDSKAK